MRIPTGAAILLMAFLPGCFAPEPANLQAELDNVARCFHESVTLLQDQPDNPNELGPFLRTALGKLPDSTQKLHTADFSALRWDKTADALVTSAGEPISFQIVEQTHDNFGPDGSAWLFEYEFFVPATPFRSRTTIELRMN